MMTFLYIFIQAIVAFLFGTVLNDIVHYSFHQFLKSKYRVLRLVGGIHSAHHRFFTSSLQLNKKWMRKNFIQHVLVEYCIIMLGIMISSLFLDSRAIVGAIIFETCLFMYVCFCRGIDIHHKALKKISSAGGHIFVNAEYHALHHIYPNYHFGSVIKFIDYLLGTGMQLSGKKIAMTGASGALGSHLKRLLEKEGAEVVTFKFGVDYNYNHYENLKEPLSHANILLLCHGSKYENAQQANCDSFIEIIELFKQVGKRSLVPLEIWGVGSEIECHPSFGMKKLQVYSQSKRNFARKAHEYFHDKDITYRHLVHSAFCSQMGPGLMTASFAARMTLFLIKRDFKYVPVTYTGIAWLNYLKFIFNQ